MGKRITLTDLELEVLSYLVDGIDNDLIENYEIQEIISRPFLKKLSKKVAPVLLRPPKENNK